MDGEREMGSAKTKDVESALAAFPGLASATVVEQRVKTTELHLVAYVVPSEADFNLAGLRVHARQLLPACLMPAAIIVVDEIPTAADGSIDLAALPVPDLDGRAPYRAAETERQEIMCALFAEILDATGCGLDDNFFDLGGQSVDAMLLAGRISAALDVQMSMADLFNAPTVAELDHRLDALVDEAN